MMLIGATLASHAESSDLNRSVALARRGAAIARAAPEVLPLAECSLGNTLGLTGEIETAAELLDRWRAEALAHPDLLLNAQLPNVISFGLFTLGDFAACEAVANASSNGRAASRSSGWSRSASGCAA